MKAAVLIKPRCFEIQDIPMPTMGAGDVLVKIHNVGICGTDIHIFHGNYARESLPLILGHELAGEVVGVGNAVTSVAVGDRITADINKSCGHCFYCRKNERLNCPDISQMGIGEHGAFADYMAIPAPLVIKAPHDMPYTDLSLVEPLSCVVRSAHKSGIAFGQSAVVIGAGPIGNLHIQLLRSIGVAPVIAVELSPIRAKLAKQCGADVVITDPTTAKEIILQATDGRGADVAIESVGHAKLYQSAFDYIRPGGHITAFGITGADDTYAINTFNMVLQELSIKGSVAGMGDDMYHALTLLAHGRINTDPFSKRIYPLEDIQQAFETFDADETVLKVQIAI